MSDNIPFEIQIEIIKKVYDVKSLVQFRSVSKQWKSFIDSSEFIKGYGARHTQPHSHILSLIVKSGDRFIRLVEDDIETFKVQQQEFAPFVVSPLLEHFSFFKVVGACHGLLCMYGVHYNESMVVIWNPCIGKSFGIAVPSYDLQTHIGTNFGFGVSPVTKDPTVVKVVCAASMPCRVEVFTLSSGVWNVIPSSNLPHKSIVFTSSQVVIDRFIYWVAWVAEEVTVVDDDEATMNDVDHVVVSFDLIAMEFKVVDLPDTLTNDLYSYVPVSKLSISKLRESLVVYQSIYVEGAECCGVWVMEHDSSFRKLFTIGARVYKILGSKKNGETIFETPTEDGRITTLDAYDPCSQQIKNIGVSGIRNSFLMGSYKESLLLLDHSDSHIYSHDS